MTLLAGQHAGYRFDAAGAIIRGASMSLANTARGHTSKRSTIPGRSGYWYYLVDGPLPGYWVVESAEVFLTPAPTPTPTPSPTPPSGA